MMNLFGGGGAQMPEGMPIPRPPKEYYQNYMEGVLRFLITVPISMIFSFLHMPITLSVGTWLAAYTFLVIFMNFKKISKQFALGFEISLFFQYFIAHVIMFVMTDNAHKLFK